MMKLKLGSKTFDVRRIQKVTCFGKSTAHVHFITGETIAVSCGITVPDRMRYTYPGTSQGLKALIDTLKGSNKESLF